MNDPATVLSAARLGWQLLARIPWLSVWLLRRCFPVPRCKDMLTIELSGNHSSFELLPDRPSHTLTGLKLHVYNPLPFSFDLEGCRLQADIDSRKLLDEPLNIRQIVPASGFARIPLLEIGLTDRQVTWVKELSREYTRVQFSLNWRCHSVIREWADSGIYEFPVFVHTGKIEQSGDSLT